MVHVNKEILFIFELIVSLTISQALPPDDKWRNYNILVQLSFIETFQQFGNFLHIIIIGWTTANLVCCGQQVSDFLADSLHEFV